MAAPDHSFMPMKYCQVLLGFKPVDIFLFHGYRSSVNQQSSVARNLNNLGYNVYACEYIGHGKRKGDNKDIYKSMLEIEKVINSRKNPVVLIGHSIGGAMALSIGARNKNVIKVFAVSALNGKIFADKKQFIKMQMMHLERISDHDKQKLQRAMPMEHGFCDMKKKDKFFLIHAKKDSIVPFSEFLLNKEVFCIPTRNTLVLDISRIGILGHIKTMYDERTFDFIEKHLG